MQWWRKTWSRCLIFDSFVKRAFKYSSECGDGESQRTRKPRKAQWQLKQNHRNHYSNHNEMLLNQIRSTHIAETTKREIEMERAHTEYVLSDIMRFEHWSTVGAVSLRASLICFAFRICTFKFIGFKSPHIYMDQSTESVRSDSTSNKANWSEPFEASERLAQNQEEWNGTHCIEQLRWSQVQLRLFKWVAFSFDPCWNACSWKCHTIRHDNAIHLLLVLHIAYQIDSTGRWPNFFNFSVVLLLPIPFYAWTWTPSTA